MRFHFLISRIVIEVRMQWKELSVSINGKSNLIEDFAVLFQEKDVLFCCGDYTPGAVIFCGERKLQKGTVQ